MIYSSYWLNNISNIRMSRSTMTTYYFHESPDSSASYLLLMLETGSDDNAVLVLPVSLQNSSKSKNEKQNVYRNCRHKMLQKSHILFWRNNINMATMESKRVSHSKVSGQKDKRGIIWRDLIFTNLYYDL